MPSSELDGLRVLPIKFDASYGAFHHLFFKPHRVREPCEEKPNLRTLFLSNVPPWATSEALKRIFTPNGPVEAVYLQKSPSSGPPPRQDGPGGEARVGAGFRYGYVVFDRPSGVRRAMEKMDLSEARTVSTESSPVQVGLEKWRREYNESLSLDLVAVEKEIEEGVAAHDAAKEEANRKTEEEEDDEGWTTVTRQNSRKAVGGGTARAQAKVKAREAKKRKRKELENFYRSQMKEKKIKRMEELREKFERDKQRQLQMKLDRKFRPQ